MELQDAIKTNDYKNVWQCCRQIGGTGLGKRKRRFDVPTKDGPNIDDWITHVQLPGGEGGWNAIPLANSTMRKCDAIEVATSVPHTRDGTNNFTNRHGKNFQDKGLEYMVQCRNSNKTFAWPLVT